MLLLFCMMEMEMEMEMDMDTNWVGMPKEGYGVSNDAKASFGPPEFDHARFSLNAKELPLHITIQY